MTEGHIIGAVMLTVAAVTHLDWVPAALARRFRNSVRGGAK